METRSPLEPGAAIVPRERGIPRSGDSSEVAANKSLPFVHTARRYYRLNDRARPSDRLALLARFRRLVGWKDRRARPFRGSKSRNKVSVGEPADGSFAVVLKVNPLVDFCIYFSGTGGFVPSPPRLPSVRVSARSGGVGPVASLVPCWPPDHLNAVSSV